MVHVEPTAIFLKLIGWLVVILPKLWWSIISNILASSIPSAVCSFSLWSTKITFLGFFSFKSVILNKPRHLLFLFTIG